MAEKPLLRGHFHQEMFFIAVGACLPLIFRCTSGLQLVAIIIYTFCALSMFGISALYHRVTWSPKKRSVWKKFDHAAIYLMIAGTATPVALLGLSQQSGKSFLIAIWSVAAVGVVQSIFFVNLPKIISALIYLAAGYMVLPYMKELSQNLSSLNIGLIVAGGIVYSVGAMTYGLKRPVLSPKYFGYHEVFHILVNIGAILHFIVVSSFI